MIARVLEPEEWGRLGEGQIPPLFPYVEPRNIAVVVVEDEGKIVATMTVLQATHIEGTWIDGEHKHVARSLLRLATTVAKAGGARWAFTGACDDKVRRIIERLGGRLIPMDTWVMPLGGV